MESSLRALVPLPAYLLDLCGQTHVDDQGLDGSGGSALFGTFGRYSQEIHPAMGAVRRSRSTSRQHFREADMPYGGRHAGETRLDGTVAGYGPCDVGPVAVFIDPQILSLAERSVGSPDTPHEVGAADAFPVGGDVQVIDVEPRVHDADGDRSAVYPRENPRGAVVRSQGVRPHGGNGRVMSWPHDSDRLDR